VVRDSTTSYAVVEEERRLLPEFRISRWPSYTRPDGTMGRTRAWDSGPTLLLHLNAASQSAALQLAICGMDGGSDRQGLDSRNINRCGSIYSPRVAIWPIFSLYKLHHIYQIRRFYIGHQSAINTTTKGQ